MEVNGSKRNSDIRKQCLHHNSNKTAWCTHLKTDNFVTTMFKLCLKIVAIANIDRMSMTNDTFHSVDTSVLTVIKSVRINRDGNSTAKRDSSSCEQSRRYKGKCTRRQEKTKGDNGCMVIITDYDVVGITRLLMQLNYTQIPKPSLH